MSFYLLTSFFKVSDSFQFINVCSSFGSKLKSIQDATVYFCITDVFYKGFGSFFLWSCKFTTDRKYNSSNIKMQFKKGHIDKKNSRVHLKDCWINKKILHSLITKSTSCLNSYPSKITIKLQYIQNRSIYLLFPDSPKSQEQSSSSKKKKSLSKGKQKPNYFRKHMQTQSSVMS